MNENNKRDIYKEVICPICGNDVTVNLKYIYHKCLACDCKIKLTLKNKRIIKVEENVNYHKRRCI